ncbi:VOC family protein [Papillibacter cinnamivorans]|uniref:Aldoketomutase n=1 Tax=Papillibacter cinnamivorans DSM 12816 TaxID=1122930 RepID=A0A1W2BTW0_9FIRM|nr:VOC family protein [Papillibacter cinnamivorans]SMC75998.1 lactoylglutathione lyase [Papillibacter cinnamivorans DSM 12816]
MVQFAHFNFNVLDVERSTAFYREALGLQVVRTVERPGFILQYLGDGTTDFTLELTQLFDRTEPYNLGENEFHLAFRTDEFETLHRKHESMGVICFENAGMGIYFISDPDGYWIEIVPQR